MRILILAALCATPVTAQSLPDWAKPVTAPPHETGGPVPSTATGPGLPSTPTPVPLDGGLALLAIAGAGMAARRLRHSA
jgi:hypothetical protein